MWHNIFYKIKVCQENYKKFRSVDNFRGFFRGSTQGHNNIVTAIIKHNIGIGQTESIGLICSLRHLQMLQPIHAAMQVYELVD